ncbi:MAG: protein kinase domain-containing protein, partial [Saprospiraceae bacterium]
MNKLYLNRKDNPIIIEKTAFASGGEGNIFHVVSPSKYRGYVVKLYHQNKRTPEKESKVRFILNNPPEIINENGHSSVVWMAGMIYDNKGFAGVLMPFAKGDKLVILCSSKIPRKYRNSWARFSFQSRLSFDLRLKICFNIAAAVYQIHKTRQYVLVDLKPDNILIQPNGLISIVDIDSMEILQDGKALFPAAVTTPEYAPPEFYKNVQPGKAPIFETWDRYSMAIIFYKLLFGIHPFAGSAKPPYDKLNGLDEKIEQGLFVHHPDKRRFFEVIPPPHKRFFDVKYDIQSLFVQCFSDGHHALERRPTANDWCSVISGKSLVTVNRKLISRALQLDNISYSEPQLLPIPSAQISKKTPVFVRTKSTLPVKFEAIGIIERISIIGIGILFMMATKSPIIAIVASFVMSMVAYNFRAEAQDKRRLKKERKAINFDVYSQEAVVASLKRATNQYNASFKGDIEAFNKKQTLLLQEEHQSINELKSTYMQMLSEKDKLLIELEEQENEEMEALKARFPEVEAVEEVADSEMVEEFKSDIARLNKELNDVEDLLKIDKVNALLIAEKKLEQKRYLLPLIHDIEKIKKKEKEDLKRNELTFDIKISRAQRKLTAQIFKSELKRIEALVNELHRQKEGEAKVIAMDFRLEKEGVLANLQSILNKKQQVLKEQIRALRTELNREKHPNHSDEVVLAYEGERQRIAERYDQEYETLLEEGAKQKAKIEVLIAKQNEETEHKTLVLVSNSVVPFKAGTQLQNYEQQSNQLVDLKNESAKLDSEIMSYESINFGAYLERFFG